MRIRARLHHLFILVMVGYLRQLLNRNKAHRSQLADVGTAILYPLLSPLMLWFDEPKALRPT